MSSASSDKLQPDPESWLDEYGDHLHGYAYYRTNDHDVVEDLVQETLLAGYKAWGRFEGRSTVKTWLTSILNRKIIDFYRKRGRERETFVSYDAVDADGREFTPEGRIVPEHGAKLWARLPDDAAEQADFWKTLQTCLSGLPEQQREVFVSREIDGLSTEDISEDRDVTPNHLWVILHRARKALRKCLEINWFRD